MKLAARRVLPLAVIALAVVCSSVASAGAAGTKIITPTGGSYTVHAAAGGKLQPFTIRASGFHPGTQVFIEQCDGRSSSAPNWTPTIDCDSGTSPAAVFTPASGVVEFSSTDLNHRFTPVEGLSPESLFACFTSTSPDGVPHFPSCKVRISTNNTQVTADQVFLDMVLPGVAGSTAAAKGSGGSGSGGSGSGGSSSTVVLVLVGVVVVFGGGGVLWMRSRRTATVSGRRS